MPKRRYKQRSDGRFEAKVQIGFQDNGRPKRITLYATTSKELEKKVNDLKYEVKHGLYNSVVQDVTMENYAIKWFTTYKATRADNTKDMYKNIIDKHINEEIGHILLKNITKSDIQNLINSRADQHRTCEQIKMTLKQIFTSAIQDDLVVKNPCIGIELPKKPHNEKRILTDIEKSAILKADFTPRERAFVYILYGCGLRRGEALALTKQDINFDTGLIQVNKSISFSVNNPNVKEPKTHSGFRSVDMPPYLIDYLKEYLKLVDILLFTMNNSKQMTKSSYDKMWRSIVKKMNEAVGGDNKHKIINGLTAHIFRHNYCTELYYSGMSLKKAVELMGHSDSKMIMDVYAHLNEKQEKTKDKIKKIVL